MVDVGMVDDEECDKSAAFFFGVSQKVVPSQT